MSQGQSIRDAGHLYEVERRVQHAARPGFRIMELQLSPTQKVPWHSHTNITDTFYVLEGHMRLFLQDPKEEVNLKPGEIHVVGAARPHLVTNGGTKSLTFWFYKVSVNTIMFLSHRVSLSPSHLCPNRK